MGRAKETKISSGIISFSKARPDVINLKKINGGADFCLCLGLYTDSTGRAEESRALILG